MDIGYVFTDLVRTFVWAGVVLYAIRRADALLRSSDWFGTAEHRVVTAHSALHPQLQDTQEHRRMAIPDDLEALALRESELWAQDDMRTVIREKFRELQREGAPEDTTWQKVRRAMGIGELP